MLDLHKYISKLILSSSIIVYDYFVEGKSTQYIKDDFYAFALSNIFSQFSSDVVFDYLNINKSGILGLVADPLVSSVLYMYFYQSMVYPKYTQVYSSQRTTNQNLLLSATINVITSFLQNPLMGLFSGYKLH